MISISGRAAGHLFQWSQKAITSRAWVAFGDVARVRPGMGAGVLGEERQHDRARWDRVGARMLFQDRVAAPVHDGVKFQVEDRLLRGGQGPPAIICLSRAARNRCWWSCERR